MGCIFRKFKIAPYFFVFFTICLVPISQATNIGTVKQKAQAIQLYDDPYWHVLLHYKKTIFGIKSVVDDKNFFLSPKGKTKPQEEMFTLIDELTGNSKETFCRFPLRSQFLIDKLGIDNSKFKIKKCTDLNNVLDVVNPKSASIIFPSAHINSPASMFGHTFLRIDGENFNPLLSKAINYSAVLEENPGMLYIIKGLFGMYSGYYSMMPYYKKVQEYGEMEFRDIWEYKLNLTQQEVVRIILHTWELKNIATDYFFFDENCSYQLLFLIEAARPGIKLTDEFVTNAIPIDTVRILEDLNMINTVTYRPSKAKKIKYLSSSLSDGARKTAALIGKGKITPQEAFIDNKFSDIERLNILDTTIEYIRSPFAKDNFTKEEYKKFSLSVLSYRGKLGKNTDKSLLEVPTPEDKEPLTGHRANKASFSFGVEDMEHFFDLSYRPANHDLTDSAIGYPIGTEIEFLSTELRYTPYNKKIKLHKIDFVKISSIAPRTTFFPSISWDLQTGIYDLPYINDDNHETFKLAFGAGLSGKSTRDNLFYFLLGPELLASEHFNYDNAFGGSLTFGFNGNILKDNRLLMTFKRTSYVSGDKFEARSFNVRLNSRLKQNHAFRIDFTRDKIYNLYSSEAKGSFIIYF